MKATAYEHTTVAGIARAGAVKSASDREQPRQFAALISQCEFPCGLTGEAMSVGMSAFGGGLNRSVQHRL